MRQLLVILLWPVAAALWLVSLSWGSAMGHPPLWIYAGAIVVTSALVAVHHWNGDFNDQ